MELYIDILSKTEETVSSEQHGTREHVTFNIIAKQILDKINDPPPTFIAQTKKHGEEQILQKVFSHFTSCNELEKKPFPYHWKEACRKGYCL